MCFIVFCRVLEPLFMLFDGSLVVIVEVFERFYLD